MSLAANKKKNTRSKSLTPSSINPYNQRTCKYRHGNKRIDSSSTTLQCNDCKSKIRKYGTVYGCARCKFYLCTACFRKPACANGHLLKATHVQRGTLCSSCQYKSKKQRLQMYTCNVCKYNMCLGCYSYETCCGNHGLKWQKITSSTHKSMNHCFKCQRIFKINKSLFMCKKCKYSLCGDCYQPSLTLKSKIHRQQKIAQKIKSDQNQQQQSQQNQMQVPPSNAPISPPNAPISPPINIINHPDDDGEELKNDDDENRLYLDDDEEDADYEEEEKKMIVLTDDHLANHNSYYNYNYPAQSPYPPIGPPSNHQSYHSYSHSNSHHSRTSNRSQNASSSRSKSRERSKKKKKTSQNNNNNNNNNSQRKKGKKKTKKKSTKKTKAKPSHKASIGGINDPTPSLSLSATSSVNMNPPFDQEFSSSFDLSGLESTCAPSEMTRIPSILTDCCICMERDKEVAFLPCGHYISCEQCAKLLQTDTGMCAICSSKIISILKIYE